eukprot:14517326-Ditylum_brightwellii.AAC.1
MGNAAALYFKEEFGQSTESAAAIASVFGWMNIFARGLGGFMSDMANARWGMKGRLLWQIMSLVLEGVLVLVFSQCKSLAGAIGSMAICSVLVQMCEGSTFGIVPYLNPKVTGTISGIVGAGGNVGGVAFAFVFREYDYAGALAVMALCILA